MHKAYKYRLYPSNATVEKLEWTLRRCCELYNAALIERRDAYHFHVRQHGNFYDEQTRRALSNELTVNYHSQQNQLPEIKNEWREEYQEIAAHVLQDVVRRLNNAFDGFFNRVKKGMKPGYPRFRSSSRYDSFTYPDGAGWKLDGRTLHLSKIGTAKIKLHRELQGKIKTVTIKVRRVSGRKRARQNVVGIVGTSHVRLAYPCQVAEISKEKGECSMLGARQRRRELPPL